MHTWSLMCSWHWPWQSKGRQCWPHPWLTPQPHLWCHQWSGVRPSSGVPVQCVLSCAGILWCTAGHLCYTAHQCSLSEGRITTERCDLKASACQCLHCCPFLSQHCTPAQTIINPHPSTSGLIWQIVLANMVAKNSAGKFHQPPPQNSTCLNH